MESVGPCLLDPLLQARVIEAGTVTGVTMAGVEQHEGGDELGLPRGGRDSEGATPRVADQRNRPLRRREQQVSDLVQSVVGGVARRAAAATGRIGGEQPPAALDERGRQLPAECARSQGSEPVPERRGRRALLPPFPHGDAVDIANPVLAQAASLCSGERPVGRRSLLAATRDVLGEILRVAAATGQHVR